MSFHLLLRRRCCLYDFTRALFCNPVRNLWMVSFFIYLLCVVFCFPDYGLLACFCHKLTFNQIGGFDHSVFDTFVQLTEGRSAWDQPKQPPAKKSDVIDRNLVELVLQQYIDLPAINLFWSNQQPVLLLTTRLLANPSPSSMKKVLRMIGSKSKWAFQRGTQCSYTIGEDLISTNQC